MRGFVLFLLSFLLIYCAEKKYRIKKLFLYPAVVLCPYVAVSSYACILADRIIRKREDMQKGQKNILRILVYFIVLLIALMAGGFQLHLELKPISIGILILSIGAYLLLGKELFCEEKQEQIGFVCICILFSLFTYPSLEGSDLSRATELSTGILVIKQILVPLILYVLLKKGTDQPFLEEFMSEEEVSVEKDSKKGMIGKLLTVKVLALAFIIFVLLTAFSIFTLNTKINNMSLYMQNMQENTEQQQTAEPEAE